MKWKSIVILIILIIVALFMGSCISKPVVNQNSGYVPSLKVIGDVEKPLIIKSLNEFDYHQLEYKGKRFKGVFLGDIIKKAEPVTNSNKILLIGDDGLTAEISGANLKGCYITFSTEYSWEAININHPVSSNIKRIKEIVVVSKNSLPDFGLNVITSEENVLNITPGQLYMKAFQNYLYFEGSSKLKKNEETYEVSIYTRRKMISLSELIDKPIKKDILAMGEQGVYRSTDGKGYIELKDNTINYISPRKNEEIKNIKGIMFDPPTSSVMDVYHDTLHYLKNNERVLIIFLDGFGYHQYKYALKNGYAPNLKKLPEAAKTTSVYKPVTNAGFAAMITGKSPEENGVYSRKQKDIKVSSIFGEAQKLHKESLLIEGNIKILNTEIEPLLNIDKNSNGSSDDEILECALKNLESKNDLIMVHFHSIDDSGHTFGDLHPATMETVKRTDGYIKELISGWSGKIIITSDHGMHSTAKGGEHGNFQYQDMIVPYILTEGH